MADFGLFLGFGTPARGREVQATKVFGEAMAYFGTLQQSGDIERTEVAVLEVHGGELGGFILLRGERERLARVRASVEFQRLLLRAGFVVNDIGVVSVMLDTEAARFVGESTAATADLT